MTDIWRTRVDVDQYQRLLGRLDLFTETIFYTRFDGGKPVSAFEVAPLDLVAAFSGLSVATGLLPQGCLFYARSGAGERVAVFLPPAVRTLTVANVDGTKQAYTIPLPPLVFVGCGKDYAVHAVKQYPGPEEGLFLAPLPNVHHDGRICQGSVKFPKASAASIHKAVGLFLQSDFNHDLADGKSKDHVNLFHAWEKLADAKADVYPLADLVGAQIKLSDLIKGVRDA